MDCNKIGNLILSLRQEKGLTQKEVANLLNISDKTVSKWERGLGCPDVSLLKELSGIFKVNIENILQGDLNPQDLNGGNMKKIKFYVCPSCGNIINSTGDGDFSCCGKKLSPLVAQPETNEHQINLEPIEDEIFISFNHPMTKDHYLSFAAYVSFDRLTLIKLYAEGNPEFRLPQKYGGDLYFYCTQHGLMVRKKLKRP